MFTFPSMMFFPRQKLQMNRQPSEMVIIEAVREFRPKNKNGKLLPKRRASMGFLPAIPIEIVRQ